MALLVTWQVTSQDCTWFWPFLAIFGTLKATIEWTTQADFVKLSGSVQTIKINILSKFEHFWTLVQGVRWVCPAKKGHFYCFGAPRLSRDPEKMSQNPFGFCLMRCCSIFMQSFITVSFLVEELLSFKLVQKVPKIDRLGLPGQLWTLSFFCIFSKVVPLWLLIVKQLQMV